MSESNRVSLAYLAEVAWGTTPASALTNIRRTGGAFGMNTNSVQSQEVRSDRQVADIIRVGTEANGTLDMELSYGTYDPLVEGAMFSAFGSVNTTTSALTVVAATSTVTMTGAFTNLVVGDWFTIADSAGNDGEYQILTRTDANEVTVTDNSTLADAAAEAGVTIVGGNRIRNGTTKKSFTFEEHFQDISRYLAFKGMRVGSMSLNIAVDQIITGSFAFMGKEALSSASTVGTGANVAASTTNVLNAIDNIQKIRENHALLSGIDVTQVSLNLENNLRALRAVGSVTPVGINAGTMALTGNLSAYFSDASLIAKYLAWTTTSLSFHAVDGAGNRIIFDMPSIKFTGGLPDPGGLDNDVMQSLDFSAFVDPTFGYTFQISRFPAA